VYRVLEATVAYAMLICTFYYYYYYYYYYYCGERDDCFLVTIRTEESHNEHIGRNLLNTFYCYTL